MGFFAELFSTESDQCGDLVSVFRYVLFAGRLFYICAASLRDDIVAKPLYIYDGYGGTSDCVL